MIEEPLLRTAAPTFAARLDAFGDRAAVIAGDHRLTYAELGSRADDIADAIGGTRRLVLVRARNDLDSLLAYVGALRGGHVVMLADADADAGADDHYDADVVITGQHIDSRRDAPVHPLHPDLALVLSTSGSTGSPKLVRLSHTNLDSNAAAIADYLALAPDDRAMTTLPMHYCYGLSVINSHLATGASLVLTDLSVVDRCFWDAFAADDATSFAGVPYTFELLDRIGFDRRQPPPRLRHITQAGGRMRPEQVRRYAALAQREGWRLYVMYGQTEATARMAYLPPDQAVDHPDCIGVPIPGGEFEIDDGELVYRGPNVMLGYAHSRADLAVGRTVDALRTGDLARRTPDGLYQIVGRRSRFAKLFGLRIDLDHLERRLDAVCAGDDDGLVIAADRHRHAAVRAQLDLPASAVYLVDARELPRLPNGKPDYAALLALRTAASTAPRPHTDVAALFARVLGCDDVGADDTFVSLGGDSLSYVETSVALERLLGDLPPDWHTTPVAVLQQRSRHGEADATRARATASAPRMETNVVVRAAAIVLVVASHTNWFEFEGGAHALLAVAGFNFARFQLVTGRMLRSVARIVVPSVVVIGAMAAVRDDFGWPHALLVNGFIGAADSRWAYWYIEAVVLILAALALLFAHPRIRALERRHPAAFAAALLAAGLLVRFLPDVSHRVARPHEVFWLFALGWVAALAPRRLVLSAVTIAATPNFFGEPTRELVVMLGVMALVWIPSVRVPKPLNRVVASLAAASLYIFLTHWAVYPWLADRTSHALTTIGALAAGVAAFKVDQACKRRVASLGDLGRATRPTRRETLVTHS